MILNTEPVKVIDIFVIIFSSLQVFSNGNLLIDRFKTVSLYLKKYDKIA